jgi:hypothetical protein
MSDNEKACPDCGRCPTCGRRDAVPYVPMYPPYQPGTIWIAPYNPWRGPWWIGGQCTNSSLTAGTEPVGVWVMNQATTV